MTTADYTAISQLVRDVTAWADLNRDHLGLTPATVRTWPGSNR